MESKFYFSFNVKNIIIFIWIVVLKKLSLFACIIKLIPTYNFSNYYIKT